MIYTVLSGKGGVGKTFLTVNLGICAARIGRKTLIVDADLATGAVAFHFGIRNATDGLQKILSTGKFSSKYLHRIEEKLWVLPSGFSFKDFLKARLEYLPRILEGLKKEYEVIFVDTPPGISRGNILPIRCSDLTVLVSTPDLPSIAATERIKTTVSMLDKKIAGIIVNRMKRGFLMRSKLPSQLKDLGELLGVVPEEKKVDKCISAGKPIVMSDPKSPASRAIREICSKLVR